MAVSEVQFRIPQDVFTKLWDISVHVHLIENWQVAYALYVWPCQAIIQVFSRLEAWERSDIEFTIAHEFAHIFLDHIIRPQLTRRQTLQEEIEASLLPEKWGFEMPEDARQYVESAQAELLNDPEAGMNDATEQRGTK
jgi:hypothetical protein